MTMATPMHLLIVTHVIRKNDGQGRVNYEIARAALDAGHRVTLLVSEADPQLAAHPNARVVLMPASRVPSRLLQYQVFAWRTAAWIRRHRHEFDVIHVNGFITWAAADVNAVHFVHDGWYRCGFYPFRFLKGPYDAYQVVFTRLNAWFERLAFERARVIVPVSEKVAEEVRAHGLGEAKLHVIHNGVDTIEFAPGADERTRFGLPAGPFMMLFAGDLRVPRKNLDTVMRAMTQVPNVHLAVAGGLKNSPYPALAKSLGIEDRVHFIGFVREMPALMRSADAFVFPSRYEAMSLVLLEALASGLPVVTVKSAGGAEVIGEHDGTVLDHPEDVDGLAQAMARLADDPAYVQRMRDASRALAQTLTWQVMAQRYLALYADLASQRALRTGAYASGITHPAESPDQRAAAGTTRRAAQS